MATNGPESLLRRAHTLLKSVRPRVLLHLRPRFAVRRAPTLPIRRVALRWAICESAPPVTRKRYSCRVAKLMPESAR